MFTLTRKSPDTWQTVYSCPDLIRRDHAEDLAAQRKAQKVGTNNMNSRTSWNVDGIDPQVRERAEAAARRAGMSLADWLKFALPESPPQPLAAQPLPANEAKEVAEIHHRLDAITRQIEQMSSPVPRGDTGVASQLNEAISRLDARLSQISTPVPAAPNFAAPGSVAPSFAAPSFVAPSFAASGFAAKPMIASPSLSPGSLEDAIAELAARQNELSTATRQSASPAAPMMAQPKQAGPDFSSLERHLQQITSQIDALQRPDTVEKSIATFRGELADIRNVITEAMPRRAIESIENEIRSLSKRIDDSRHNGSDGKALAGIERALADIKEVLRSLTPAEQLAGFDTAIRNLGSKIDMIVRSSDDPGTIQQLEGAIAALRAIVSNVASNESLGRLSDDVRMLAAKVDQFSHPDSFNEGFAALEQRIAALTTTLEKRPQAAVSGHSEHLEGALRALSDRLDHLPVGNDSSAAFSHLEQRVSYLLERLEMNNDNRGSNLGKVEAGLHDILRHLEEQTATISTLVSPSIAPQALGMDPVLVDQIKRELSEMRFSQTETDRHTQDSLEIVHNTLGHVVDRLAMIEGDLRAARATPALQPMAAMPRPELPNPVARMTAAPAFAPAARPTEASTAAAVAAPRAISDILDQQPKPAMREAARAPAFAEMPYQPQSRPAFTSDLPPDHPLEPGTLPHGRIAMPSERSGDVASDEPASTSSFIAAARRAAQAAAAAVPAQDKAKGKAKRPAPGAGDAAESSTITTKIRSLLVGASVVVIVLGSFKMAMTLLEGSTQTPVEAASDAKPSPMRLDPPESSSRPLFQAPAAPAPSITSPTPIGRQSLVAPQPDSPFAGIPMSVPTSAPTQLTNADVTGSIPQQNMGSSPLPPAGRKPTQIAIPSTEKLPDAVAGPTLRAAALKGDPTAAYEIGLRYAEARGVPANYDEAAKWYDRAAQAGIVPAMFRIGTLYEKGLSVKKDLEVARKYYAAAAERGNAKAMHNLAVLDADGGGSGANYKGAAQWFRKAADRGVADSQYNLGILYARGIGVEQNLAESFKWFSLAAAQGDTDSATKRDDLAKRLDPQSLAAAKLAIQTFTAEPQPDDAVTVATPAGGWDNTGSPPAKPAKRAAR
jgi:localization factor PodJL